MCHWYHMAIKYVVWQVALSVVWWMDDIADFPWPFDSAVELLPCKLLTLSWASYLCQLQWRHNKHGGVLNHRRLDCLLNRLFRRRSRKMSKLRVTGLCEWNPPGTGEFPLRRASNAKNVSIWWRHHVHAYNYCECNSMNTKLWYHFLFFYCILVEFWV